jgi:hypothetical protein
MPANTFPIVLLNQLFLSVFAECVPIPRRPVGEDPRPDLQSKVSAKCELEQHRHRDNQVDDKGNSDAKGAPASR